MGQATGAFFATQIGAWQSAHLRWTDDTFGFGMSVTREQTMHMRSPMAYNIALASSELDFNAANVTKNNWEQPYLGVVKPRPFPKNV